MSGLPLLGVSSVSVLATVVVLAIWGRVQYARRLSFFRCRLGPRARRLRGPLGGAFAAPGRPGSATS
jgi:hypothetical protein